MPIELKKIHYRASAVEQNSGVYFFAKFLSFLKKDFHFGDTGLKDKKKESFYSELKVLLSSGVDIRTGLDIVVEEQKRDDDKKLFGAIKNDVISGASLSDAIYNTGKFSTYEYYSLKIGEESGQIREVLTDLSNYFSKRIKQRRQLTSAITYPIMVIVTAILAVVFMLNFIVPMFMDVFKRFNGDIPAITQLVISLSIFFRKYSWVLFLMIITFIVFFLALRKKDFFRKRTSSILLKMPVFGDIVKKIYLTRFCQSMSLLLGAKTPMIRSLQLVRKMIDFYHFEKALEIIEFDILHGKLLHESMAQFPFFDNRIVSLIKVAEEVNKLEVIFSNLNDQYNEELEHKISMLSNLLEPVMIIIVGLLVALILISMYLPLFQLSSSIY